MNFPLKWQQWKKAPDNTQQPFHGVNMMYWFIVADLYTDFRDEVWLQLFSASHFHSSWKSKHIIIMFPACYLGNYISCSMLLLKLWCLNNAKWILWRAIRDGRELIIFILKQPQSKQCCQLQNTLLWFLMSASHYHIISAFAHLNFLCIKLLFHFLQS